MGNETFYWDGLSEGGRHQEHWWLYILLLAWDVWGTNTEYTKFSTQIWVVLAA